MTDSGTMDPSVAAPGPHPLLDLSALVPMPMTYLLKSNMKSWVWVSCFFQVLESLKQSWICPSVTGPDTYTVSSICQTQFYANSANAHNNKQLRNWGTLQFAQHHTADRWWSQNENIELSQPTLDFMGTRLTSLQWGEAEETCKEHAFLKLPFPTQHLSHHLWWRTNLNPW